MYEIFSSSTPSYYPGIVALWNSIKFNSPRCSLAVFCYDNTEKYKGLEELGIKVILNAPLPGPIIDKGRSRGVCGPVNEDMYARLIIPEYQESGKAFYVDADCLILNPIYELWDTLDLKGYPTACVFRPDIGWVGGHKHDDMASGTYLLDIALWKEKQIMTHCFNIMKKYDKIKRQFHVNVESVLSYIHAGHFLKLDRVYQNLTYYGVLSQEDKVAHFAADKPWNSLPCNYKKLWKAYYEHDWEQISEITETLPKEKSPLILNRTKRTQVLWS